MIRSRRTFLTATGSLAALAAFPTIACPGNSDPEDAYSDIRVTDAWVKATLSSFHATAGALLLGRFSDPMYFLLQSIHWTPNPGQTGSAVSAPKGFVTDFASVPRIFWAALPRDGLYTYPAILHDYLYWEQPVSRKEADAVLDYAMDDFKVPAATRRTVYAAVRAGGGSAWDDNAKRKAAGEKRTLRKFPDDPTTTWAAWKAGDVF